MFLLGQLVEGQKNTNDRLDEITATQREQAASLQHLAQVQEQQTIENERAHGEMTAEVRETRVEVRETKAGLDALGDTVKGLQGQRDALSPEQGPSTGHKETTTIKAWGEAVSAIKTHAPWLITVGLVLWGVIKGALDYFHGKGGTPSP